MSLSSRKLARCRRRESRLYSWSAEALVPRFLEICLETLERDLGIVDGGDGVLKGARESIAVLCERVGCGSERVRKMRSAARLGITWCELQRCC